MKRFWLAALTPLLLVACGGEEHSDIKEWMKDAAKDIHPSKQRLPEMKIPPVVAYDAGDLIDPFRPSKIEPEKKVGGGGKKPNLDRRKEELENYPLESLKFVGLLRNDKMLYAVIKADARIYRVKIGNYMGQDFGMVTDIQMDEGKLVLRELVQDPAGDWIEREQVLELQQAQEAKK